MNRSSFIAICLLTGMMQVVLGAFIVFLFMLGIRPILHGFLLQSEFWYRVLNFPFGILLNVAMVTCLFVARSTAIRYIRSPHLSVIVPAAVFILLYTLLLIEGGFFVGYPSEALFYASFGLYLVTAAFFTWHKLAHHQHNTLQPIP